MLGVATERVAVAAGAFSKQPNKGVSHEAKDISGVRFAFAMRPVIVC
jgi:hypothetical protein